MLVRALIVLLIALNLGAAAWWIARPARPAPAQEALPPGVARLRLVGEPAVTNPPAPVAKAAAVAQPATTAVDASAAAASGAIADAAPKPVVAEDKAHTPPQVPAPAAASAVATSTPLPAAATPTPAPVPAATAPIEAKPQCFSVGPFADAGSAASARARLQPLAQKLALRTQSGGGGSRGWRVYMPSANAEAAQATAQRIRAAGFNDLFVMSGNEAHAVALGRFRSEESARKRGAELAAAGFAAQVESLDDNAGGATWIDVATTTSNGEALRRAAGASRWRGRSCSGLG